MEGSRVWGKGEGKEGEEVVGRGNEDEREGRRDGKEREEEVEEKEDEKKERREWEGQVGAKRDVRGKKYEVGNGERKRVGKERREGARGRTGEGEEGEKNGRKEWEG